MRCPFCGHSDTQVVETRESDEGDTIRRRRKCPACDMRFTTFERAEIGMPSVTKKDGSHVEYDPSKLRASMMLALRKRPVSLERIDACIKHIEQTLRSSGLREISTTQLGDIVMRELKQLDKVAYVRFASVYRSFEDVEEFGRLIQEI